eukprot:CAMPEP_0181057822 /NCGR_PEP_ID=MMETSP1070-20121207/20463_1 /TAXON_ID=265543 /ORGANISM="Minutocellus polymorphus, Strain NH13" /LENGTH=412 /DNA_ID=CAMNT_0023137277 /DNA_START=473 /DNA_END=1711 /DNA_ORIENTATION=-
MAYNEDSSASGHDEPWIQWFCGLKGHEMFCEVERSYIEDGFNLYGLRACVSNFSDCLDLILDRIGPDDSDDSHLTQSACTLYGLIHARYIITAHGLDAMYNKYAAKEFGTCPLIQCNGQPVLPVGLRDEMGADTVKIFCPRCKSVYHPPPIRSRSSHHGPGAASGTGAVDGAAFGTTFPHLFLMTFNNLVPDPLDSKSKYVPRVFGFRVHHSARQRISPGGSASAGLPSSTTVPQGNVGRSRHASGGSAAAAALTRSSGGGRASAGGSAAAAAVPAGAAGPSSPPVEVGLPAVSADGKQNGKAGNGNGNFKATRGAAAAPAAASGGAGGSKSSGSGGRRVKTSATKGGATGGAGAAKGGVAAKANSGGPSEKRKAASGAKANADGVKGGGAGDNNSTGSRAKRSKKAAAGAS